MQCTSAGGLSQQEPNPCGGFRLLTGTDPEEDDWDAFLPDDDETYPEPGDFWIEDDDWDEAA